MIDHKITIGLSTIYKKEVGHAHVMPATNGAGIMDFLVSTPGLLTIIIEASSELLDPLLPEGYITVGKHIELSHERPTLVGEIVTLVISVTKVRGESVYLEFTGHDSTGIICRGTYERSMVNKDHLIEVAYRRSKNNK